ncbi:hypothetical protein BDK51DRAFT_30110, partial [Blyttiomyces helicus]
MAQVAAGLGHDAQFAVFPNYSLTSFRKGGKEEGAHAGLQTIFFSTETGIDMYRLQLVDELARRVASYAAPAPPVLLPRRRWAPNPAPPRRGVRGALIRAATMNAMLDTLPGAGPGPGWGGRDEEAGSCGGAAGAGVVEGSVDEYGGVARRRRGRRQSVRFASALGSDANAGPAMDSDSDPDEASTAAVTDPLLPPTSTLQDQILALATHGHRLTSFSPPPSPAPLTPPSAPPVHQTLFEVIAVEDAGKRLTQIVTLPPLYPTWARHLLSGVAAGAGAGLFFDGGWADCGVSFVLGAALGVLGEICQGKQTLSKMYEFLGAVLVSCVTRTLMHFDVPLCYTATTLAAIMVDLVQGVTITLAMVELATKNIVSGTTRLAYGLAVTGII